MPAQHKYLPHHLALTIALALGCAEFSLAQQLSPEAASAVVDSPVAMAMAPEADPLARLETVMATSTNRTVVDALTPNNREGAFRLGRGNDVLVVVNGGRFEGRIAGGAGTDIIQLDAPDGGDLPETLNVEGLYVKQGTWTSTGKGDLEIGARVFRESTLINNGEIRGHVQVDPSATLGGTGTVGSLHVEGYLIADKLRGAPHVSGDMTLTNSAQVRYGITADGSSETIKVDGTAHLNKATLSVVAAPPDYEQSHHIVLEAGKLEGEFGPVVSNLAYMTPVVTYDATKAMLSYTRNEVPVASVATSENARRIADSLEPAKPGAVSQASSSAAVSALLRSTKQGAQLALEQLAAGSNANLAKTTLSAAGPVSDSLLAAMRRLDSAAQSGSRHGPRIAAGGGEQSRVWLQALGHGGKLDRDFDTLHHSTQGLVLGADWRLDEEWRLGLIGGKSQTRMDAKQLDGDLDSWHVGAYALRQNGPMSLRLGATYSSHDGSSKRTIAFNGFRDSPKGRYDASTQQAFAEVGYNLGRANHTIEPFASLGYQRYQRDGFTEKGGAAALKVYEQAQSNLNSTFGLRLAQVNTLDNGMRLTPRLSAGWKHTYGKLDSVTRQKLVAGGRAYDLDGALLDRNSLKLDAGLDLGVSKDHTLGVGLTGELGTDSRNHGLMGQWRMVF